MFNHDHHQTILTVLRALNASLFRDTRTYFGGGTYTVLRCGEYRWSQDIDFVCSVREGTGYRLLRKAVHEQGLDALFSSFDQIEVDPTRLKTDQYGIRLPVRARGHLIKLEIFCEARICLEPPEDFPGYPLPCLSWVDLCAEKLMANADRWRDESVLSRDVIDLAMIRQQGAVPAASWIKAEGAYGDVREQLRRALRFFHGHPEHQAKCWVELQIAADSRETIAAGMRQLAADLGVDLSGR